MVSDKDTKSTGNLQQITNIVVALLVTIVILFGAFQAYLTYEAYSDQKKREAAIERLKKAYAEEDDEWKKENLEWILKSRFGVILDQE